MADFVCPVLMPEAALSGLTVAKNGTLPLAEYGSASPLRHVEWR
ncbi:MAG: hypothetical protein JWL63_2178 [Rhodocyclales bacterium]|nr:hypothetical protein [Rhodocyclales bacterium]